MGDIVRLLGDLQSVVGVPAQVQELEETKVSKKPHPQKRASKPAGLLQHMLHIPQLEAESLYCIKYCDDSKIQRELGHV